MIDVGGEDDVFIFEGGIGAGELGDNVGGVDVFLFELCLAANGDVEREVRERLAVFAECGEFAESVARACKQDVGLCGIHEHGHFLASSLVEDGISKIHTGVNAVQGYA